MNKLRQRRAGAVHERFLNDARGEHTVDVDFAQPPHDLLRQLRIDHAVEVHHFNLRVRLAAKLGLDGLQPRVADAAADESGVCAQRLDKGVLAALDRFFKTRLRDAADALAFYFEAHCALVGDQNSAAAERKIGDNVADAAAPLRVCTVSKAVHHHAEAAVG